MMQHSGQWVSETTANWFDFMGTLVQGCLMYFIDNGD